MLACSCFAGGVTTQVPASSINMTNGWTLQVALDAWDLSLRPAWRDRLGTNDVSNVVSNYFGYFISQLVQNGLSSYTYAFTTNSLFFGEGTHLRIPYLTTENLALSRGWFKSLSATGHVETTHAFVDFTGPSSNMVLGAATIASGRISAGSVYADQVQADSVTAQAFGMKGTVTNLTGMTVSTNRLRFLGDVYLFKDDSLADMYTEPVLDMTVRNGTVSYKFNPSFVIPMASGPRLAAGRYRAYWYTDQATKMVETDIETRWAIPLARLGPPAVSPAKFSLDNTFPGITSGVTNYSAKIYLSPLLSSPNVVTPTNRVPPDLPTITLWTPTNPVIPPYIPEDVDLPGGDLPSTPDPSDPESPVICWQPPMMIVTCPTPASVSSSVKVCTSRSWSEITRAGAVTWAYPGMTQSGFFSAVTNEVRLWDQAFTAQAPPGPEYAWTTVYGKVTAVGDGSAPISGARAKTQTHFAYYMVYAADTFAVYVTKQTAQVNGYTEESPMASPVPNMTWHTYVLNGAVPQGTAHADQDGVFAAGGTTCYWVSQVVGEPGYWGATTTYEVDTSGNITSESTYGLDAYHLGVPEMFRDWVVSLNWYGERRKRSLAHNSSTAQGRFNSWKDSDWYFPVSDQEGSREGAIYGGNFGDGGQAHVVGGNIFENENEDWYAVATVGHSLTDDIDVLTFGSVPGNLASALSGEVASVSATPVTGAVVWRITYKPRCR